MRRNKVTVLAQLRLHPNFVEEGKRDLLRFANTVVRKEKDCSGIEIVQDFDEPTQITMIEKWSSRAAYQGPHLQTPHMKAFVEESGKYFDGPARISIGQGTEIGESDPRGAAPYGR